MNVKAGHFLKDEDFSSFDASFFNVSPNEAKVHIANPKLSGCIANFFSQAMDPRQRMHLEGAYEALENG